MVDEAVGEVVGIAVDALEGIGSLADTSSRRRRRSGCWWLALIGVMLIAVGIGVMVLHG